MDAENDAEVERAVRLAALPAPLAPYWEGRTFDDALETSFRELTTEGERAELFERLFALLDRTDHRTADNALSRLNYALKAEADDDDESGSDDRSATPQRHHLRLERILAAVEQRLAANPDLLEAFCSHFYANREEHQAEQICRWLNRLDAASLNADALLAARILFGAYGATWGTAGNGLLAALDHDDLTVRACAAYQIGTFCRRLAPAHKQRDYWRRDFKEDRRRIRGMASLADYWDLIRKKELQRAGVAGAFWHSAPTWTIDADDWLLTLLEQAEPEPYIAYFPCNLGFCAHERFSQNPGAIRRLLDAGRTGIALEAATEENTPIPGLEPILMELGENDDAEIVRRASWILAYAYNRLHPNGARLGYVQRHSVTPDYDLFLLFADDLPSGSPYTVVLYPIAPRRDWSREEADLLVDRVFPPVVRGEASSDELTGQRWYQRGFVLFAAAGKRKNAARVSRITIGYRSHTYWNPLEQ